MQFVRRDVWHVTFLEPGLQKPLPKTLTFRDEGKIRELARRGEAWQTCGGSTTAGLRHREGRGRCVLAAIAWSNTRGSGGRESKKEPLGVMVRGYSVDALDRGAVMRECLYRTRLLTALAKSTES